MSRPGKDAAESATPMLANLVRAGDGQTEAIAINDFIFMAQDISNAYLVTTDDGDILVNTGFMDNAERNKGWLAEKRTGPLRHIVITQGHADHYGGVPEMREPDTLIVAGKRFEETCAYFKKLGPYLQRRSAKLWASTMRRGNAPKTPPDVTPDIAVEKSYEFEVGERQFEVLLTPGGESPDGLIVWMPREKVVFTGNLFGPVFRAMPNLNTLRGDKPRSVDLYLECLDRVRALGAELLVTGHGEPIRGAEKISSDLADMHAAVSHVRDAVIVGMNAGKDVHTLMREVQLPPHLQIGEFHGKTSWAVRSIWEGYSGWFYYDSTTALYATPRASVYADLCELAGGSEKLAARARVKLNDGATLEALHLLDVALGAEPSCRRAHEVKKDALESLLRAHGGENLSETMWLRSEISLVDEKLQSLA